MKKAIKIFEIISMIITTISFSFAVFWFVYALYYKEIDVVDASSGLGFAIGVIFNSLAAFINIILSTVGIVISLIINQNKDKTNIFFLIFNIIILVLTIIMGIILYT